MTRERLDVVTLVGAVTPGTELYLCGPIRLMDAVRRAWIERELPYPLCKVRVLQLAGDIDHRDVFYSERQKDARSKMCCCVSRVVGPGDRPALVTIELT